MVTEPEKKDKQPVIIDQPFIIPDNSFRVILSKFDESYFQLFTEMTLIQNGVLK